MILVKTEQKNWMAALQPVAGIVDKKTTMPILHNVLIRITGQSVGFTAYDLQTQMQSRMAQTDPSLDQTQEFTLNAKKLMDILRTIEPDKTVSLQLKDGKFSLHAGKSKFTMQSLPAADFPEMEPLNQPRASFMVPARELRRCITRVHTAMAVNDVRFFMKGMLMELDADKLITVSTDGHRLAKAEIQLDQAQEARQVILPRKTTLELLKYLKDSPDNADTASKNQSQPSEEEAGQEKTQVQSGPSVEVQIGDNQIRFQLGDMVMVSKLIEGRFPDYKRILRKPMSHGVTLGRETLLQGIQRAAVLMDDKLRVIRMTFKPGSILMEATNNDQEDTQEELEVEYEGPEVATAMNVTYLQDGLTQLETPMACLRLEDSSSGLILQPANEVQTQYLVGPMRV
jgi:DNA polymerase-3 subunit beta